VNSAAKSLGAFLDEIPRRPQAVLWPHYNARLQTLSNFIESEFDLS
jgi:hypothetical protein